ncbi:MAG: lipocalin-like domain-containing protein, partial [Pseudomonadota bacterium]
MNVKAVIVAAFAALTAAHLAFGQGFAGLGTSADDYAPVRPNVTLSFPRDHSAHPAFRIEWWYLTANLDFADGREGGAQWTLFRQASRPYDGASGWDSGQVWMGHAALTLPDAHYVAERFARGGVGQAGVAGDPFSAWIDHWHMTSPDQGYDTLTLSARGEAFGYDLTLNATGPLVLHGEKGHSVKSEQGQASYYYSQPHYQVTGTAMVEGAQIAVTGTAWLDREWSSQPLSADQ